MYHECGMDRSIPVPMQATATLDCPGDDPRTGIFDATGCPIDRRDSGRGVSRLDDEPTPGRTTARAASIGTALSAQPDDAVDGAPLRLQGASWLGWMPVGRRSRAEPRPLAPGQFPRLRTCPGLHYRPPLCLPRRRPGTAGAETNGEPVDRRSHRSPDRRNCPHLPSCSRERCTHRMPPRRRAAGLGPAPKKSTSSPAPPYRASSPNAPNSQSSPSSP
jgi:hypothetical protein